jgi:hypothetical protein
MSKQAPTANRNWLFYRRHRQLTHFNQSGLLTLEFFYKKYGSEIQYTLLADGSQTNFVTEGLAQTLKAKITAVSYRIFGINGRNTQYNGTNCAWKQQISVQSLISLLYHKLLV